MPNQSSHQPPSAFFGPNRRKMPLLLLALVFLFLTVGSDLILAARHKHYHRVPVIDLNGAEELIGVIREDERIATVSPHLHILKKTGPVCRYELMSASEDEESADHKRLPFEARILDNALGTAQIRLREGAQIDCSDGEYRMRLVAVRCADDSAKSEPVLLKVTIQDVNNHAPEFDAPWYAFDVEEGKVAEITRLFATDRDCGHPYGKVCRYEITNALEGSPFSIDDQGILRTVRPLNLTQADSHILTIVAHDCGMLRSKSTLVTIHVKARCVDGIRQANGAVSIAQGDAPRKLMSRAEVVACSGEHVCRVRSAEVQLSLAVGENPRDFSSDTLKECGLNGQETVELLPATKLALNQTSDADADSDSEPSDETSSEEATDVHLFDGETSVVVPSDRLHSVIPEKFALHFSMRSDAGTKEEQKQKQSIVCETDALGMNRHHFAVYLRHCKLELLLRREPENAAAEFRAAEWRWSDARVCDGQWHSYALIFSDLDNVQLLVDGEKFNASERNPEILDDWPLHDGKQKKTKLVVGACWHGRTQQMVQFFNGHLSSVYLLPGKTESASAFACLHRNHERLRFTAVDQLVSGESVTLNNAHSQLRLKANTLEDLSLLLQKVEYAVDARLAQDGTRTAPAVRSGTRTITVSGHMMCLGEGNSTVVLRPLAPFDVKVRVEGAPLSPQLSISGQRLVGTSSQSLKAGTALLPAIQITVTEAAGTKGSEDASKKYKLDWCRVHLKPSRDMDLEYFSSPATLIASLNVDFVHDKQGIMLKGEETPENYARILTKVHYFNTRPESYPKRLYTVQCAMLGGKLLSNEFSVTMTVDAGKQTNELDESIVKKLEGLSRKLDDFAPSPAAETTGGIDEGGGTSLQQMERHFEPSFDQLGSNRLQNILEMDLPRPKALLSHHGYEVGQGAVAGGAVAIVVVVCVGFLLVLLVIGVVKMRDGPSPKRRRSRKDSMLEWDDNGMNMNLTINPLEEVGKPNLQPADGYFEDEEEHELDIESCSEDAGEGRSEDELTEDDDEEDERANLPLAENGRQGLEWDDDESALGPSNVVSKSYRV